MTITRMAECDCGLAVGCYRCRPDTYLVPQVPGVTFTPYPSDEEEKVKQLRRIADALEKLAGKL